jgi:hypothetical protein
MIPVIIHSSRELSNREITLVTDANAFIYSKHQFNEEGGSKGLLQLLATTGTRL